MMERLKIYAKAETVLSTQEVVNFRDKVCVRVGQWKFYLSEKKDKILHTYNEGMTSAEYLYLVQYKAIW
jgi:hypothetical protein